jgi:HAD superfamily hydrolase (TIGR01450 family)
MRVFKMGYGDTWGAQAAFERYEAVRHRMPNAQFPRTTQDCSGLLEIADAFDAFLLDSFGVLNVGETAIAGAVDCLADLRARGKHLIVLTNAASYPRSRAVQRYRRLGFDLSAAQVVSSRDVAAARLRDIQPDAHWGAIAAPEDTFRDIGERVSHWAGQDVDGFVLLSTAAMTQNILDALIAALKESPRPVVVANPDLVAPRENGLSKEPGFFAHHIADVLRQEPNFFGKPFANAFVDAKARLAGIAPERIAMVGDTLHTDILGGAAAGFKTVLVRDHGLFAGHDPQPFIESSGIRPDYSCASI